MVALEYTLTNEAGELLDGASADEPLEYLHGADNLIPGLESALDGREVGEKIRVQVPPEQGYGPREGPGPQPVPRDAFPDDLELEPGMQFVSEDEDGDEFPVWVARVEDGTVYVDVDHPLAGQVLNFEVTVLSVREATGEEMAHGHPHPGGCCEPDDDEDT
ncbi:MAG: peptidylprolyl isomerase [Acidobacteria bacterium]|nr:peptidylprolyl isomerase [Acidobacteriota bacterium]